SLRAQLAEMSGEELDDEQTAVRARAERIIELDRGGQQPADRRYRTGTARPPQSAQAEQTKKRAARGSQPGASARAASSAGSRPSATTASRVPTAAPRPSPPAASPP